MKLLDFEIRPYLPQLDNATLALLPSAIQRPSYNRAAARVGIAHVGVGAFHRAHQQVYYQKLLELDASADCSVVGINLRPESSELMSRLQSQDGLYTLSTIATDDSASYAAIGSLASCLDAVLDPQAALRTLADPSVRIVSSTVTETGYYLKVDGSLDSANADIAADLSNNSNNSCNSLYGLLLQASRLRFGSKAARAPLTLLCCDNIVHNGAMLRSGLEQFFAASGEQSFWQRIVGQLSFPNTMVDRITPRAPEQSQAIADAFAIEDNCAVLAEDYLQWVVEDEFVGGRPALERVGVEFTSRVGDWENMKLRVLNAAHLAIGFLGLLRGHEFVDQALGDKVIADFTRDYLISEAVPALEHPPMDALRYCQLVLDRFRNRYLGDTTRRVAIDACDKIPNFVLPTIRARLREQQSCKHATTLLTFWYLLITADAQSPSSNLYADPHKQRLREQFLGAGGFAAFAQSEWLWGDLASSSAFRDQLHSARAWAETQIKLK